MARKVYKNLGARISKVKQNRIQRAENAARVVVVPEISVPADGLCVIVGEPVQLSLAVARPV